MADEQIGIDLLLNSGAAATSVRELKQSIRDLQGEALKAGAAGDDALAAKFTSAAGKARDRMADLNKEINAAQDTGSKLGAVTGVARSLAGGFAGAAGAAALFGGAQKDVQEQLLKVQGAVALLAGIQEVADIKKNFNIAKTIVLQEAALIQTKLGIAAESGGIVVRNLAAAAQWALNAAMSANPIMLVVVAIGALVAAFKIFSKESETAAEKTAKLNAHLALQEKVLDLVVKKLKEEQLLRAGGLSDLERENELLKVNGATKEEVYKSDRKILEQKLKDWEIQKAAILSQRVLTAEELNTQADLNNKLLVLDADFKKKTADENAKANEEAKKKRKEENDKKLEEQKKAAEKELELRNQLAQSIVNSIPEDREKEIANMQLSFRNKIEAIKGEGETENALRAQLIQEQRVALLELDNKFEKEDADAKKAKEEKDAADKKVNDEKDKKDAADKLKLTIDNETKIREAKISIAQSTITSLAAFAKLLNLQGSAALGLQKTLAIAQIAVDAAKSISAANLVAIQSAAATGPAAVYAYPIFYASTIATVLGSIASAYAALNTSAPSVSTSSGLSAGGGATAPLTPTTTNVGSTSTTLTEQSSQSPVIVKAYVVESELTGTQQHIKNIEQKATFP